jgi:hypothetical protein
VKENQIWVSRKCLGLAALSVRRTKWDSRTPQRNYEENQSAACGGCPCVRVTPPGRRPNTQAPGASSTKRKRKSGDRCDTRKTEQRSKIETASNEPNTTPKHTAMFRSRGSTSQDKWIKFEPHGKQNLYFIKTMRPKIQSVHGGHRHPSLI